MCLLLNFVEELEQYLTGTKNSVKNIIRKHTKKLDNLGDVSFPLSITNWAHFIDKKQLENPESATIFDYLCPETSLDQQIDQLVKKTQNWTLKIERIKVIEDDIHLYLNKEYTFNLCIRSVQEMEKAYGFQDKVCESNIKVQCDNTETDLSKISLTDLRLQILQKVASNFVNKLIETHNELEVQKIMITTKSCKGHTNIVCGAVLNENNKKDLSTTASDLFQ